nr:unnamed protein product [Spirometra erinaceieuropaei]
MTGLIGYLPACSVRNFTIASTGKTLCFFAPIEPKMKSRMLWIGAHISDAVTSHELACICRVDIHPINRRRRKVTASCLGCALEIYTTEQRA